MYIKAPYLHKDKYIIWAPSDMWPRSVALPYFIIPARMTTAEQSFVFCTMSMQGTPSHASLLSSLSLTLLVSVFTSGGRAPRVD